MPHLYCTLPSPTEAPPHDPEETIVAGVRPQIGTTPPEPIRRRVPFRGRFLPGYPMLWHEDPELSTLTPFWCPRSWGRHLQQIRGGGRADTLPVEIQESLRAAGLLCTQTSAARRGTATRATIDAARRSFAAHHYADCGMLLDPHFVGALQRYYRSLTATEGLPVGDDQCPGRIAMHNESVARFIHHQLGPVVSEIAGEPLRPSYVYLGAYLEGARLRPHIDRAQCEVSVTLLVDRTPAGSAWSWPLLMQLQGKWCAKHQTPGQGLIYRGRAIRHARPRLLLGRSTSLFLHYVPTSFRGKLD